MIFFYNKLDIILIVKRFSIILRNRIKVISNLIIILFNKCGKIMFNFFMLFFYKLFINDINYFNNLNFFKNFFVCILKYFLLKFILVFLFSCCINLLFIK